MIHELKIIFEQETDKREGRTWQSWQSAYRHFLDYTRQKSEISPIKNFVDGFKLYLLDKVGRNSAALYWQKFNCVMSVYFEHYTEQKFKMPKITNLEAHREHLTLSEVKTLVNTFCASETIKNMALFSCLTGMRYSDIQKLRLKDITKTENGYMILFVQMKTMGVEYLPISDQAKSLIDAEQKSRPDKNLPEQKSDQIFKIQYSDYMNGVLKKWVADAGITRKITFHCFRHTYACLQLQAGTDLFTVSKMLGHKDLKTTQIYGKIADHTKRLTVDRIKL